MAEEFKINYESVITFASSLKEKSQDIMPVHVVLSDSVSTMPAKKNCDAAYKDNATKLWNLLARGVQENNNLNTLAEKFKETDENCSKQ